MAVTSIAPFNKDFFKKHQSKLLWFANSWIGRKILYLDGKASSVGKNKITRIEPNSITWKNGDQFTTELRVHNKYAFRIKGALYPIWYLFHLWDTIFANNLNPNLNFGLDTLTKYPDADPETNTVDGRVRNSGAIYATVQSAADGTGALPSSSNEGCWHGYSVPTYYVDREFYLFDTSSLTAQAAIASAVFTIYIDNQSVAQTDSHSMVLVSSTPASNTNLTTADFDQLGTTSFGSFLFSDNTASVPRNNNITLNASGLAAISKTSITKFGTRADRDISASAPTGVNYLADIFFSDDTSGTKDPKLVVTYVFPRELATTSFSADANLQGYWRLDAPTELYSTSLLSDANLQGYWRLESSGVDSSPNGYTLTGTAPTYTTGLFGNGGDFELGSSQYLSIADASCPNLEISGSQSWSCWVKPETHSALGIMIGKANNTSGTSQHRLYLNTDGTVGLDMEGLTTNNFITSTEVIADGVWSHLLGVYDSANTKLKIFVNGVKKEVTASGSVADSNANFSVGCEFSGASDIANRFFDGIIDDVAIFNRALTDDEAGELYGIGKDSTANNYNLEVKGNAVNSAGLFGNGVTTAVTGSKYLTRSNASGIANLITTSSHTFVGWIKAPSEVPEGNIIAVSNGGATTDDIFISGGVAYMRRTGLTTNTTVSSSVTMVSATWYHVAGIYDSANTKLKIFVNGVKTEVTASGAGDTLTSPNLNIGGSGAGANLFDGIIDDVAFFNRALTDTEVANIYNGNRPVSKGIKAFQSVKRASIF